METNAQTQISGGCVTRNNLTFYLQLKAVKYFLQHTLVKGNFVYFYAAHSEFYPNDTVTYELTEMSLIPAF